MSTQKPLPKHLKEAIDTQQWDTIPQVIDNTLAANDANKNPVLMLTMADMLMAVKQYQLAIYPLTLALGFHPVAYHVGLIHTKIAHNYAQLKDYPQAKIHSELAYQVKNIIACHYRPIKKIIAFSLYGHAPKYCENAILNAQVRATIYPDWQMVVYHDDSVPSHVLARLTALQVELINAKNIDAHHMPGTFWRFLALERQDVDAVIMRDVDSIINEREKILVETWLASDKPFHIIRDWFTQTEPILAGLWGARKGLLGNIRTLIDAYLKEHPKIHPTHADQYFLTEKVWSRIKDYALHHCSVFDYEQATWVEALPVLPIIDEKLQALGSCAITKYDVQTQTDYCLKVINGHDIICQYDLKQQESFELPPQYAEKIESGEWRMQLDPLN